MRRILLVLLIALSVGSNGCSSMMTSAENSFQNDADLLRLEHLIFWSELVEEYHAKTGDFPFQEKLNRTDQIGLVKIATKQQRSYLSPGSSNYNQRLDNNADDQFKEMPVYDFVQELESVLGRTINEKYDIQKVPTTSPVGYYYFFTKDGYLIWTTCITCGTSKISTLLMDGFTPTVNIVSNGMKGQVPKALLRSEMMSHPIFKAWIAKPFINEGHARSVVAENSHDSKK